MNIGNKDNQQPSLSDNNIILLNLLKNNISKMVSSDTFRFNFNERRAVIIPVDRYGFIKIDRIITIEPTEEYLADHAYYVFEEPITRIILDIDIRQEGSTTSRET